MKNLVAVILGLLLLPLGDRATLAQTTPELLDQIDQDAARYLARRSNGALVVGVIQGEKIIVRGFGSIVPGEEGPPVGSTIFEIGSVTKVFNGILLSKLIAEEVVALDDPIDRFLPVEVELPDAMRAITFRHLATHTSGLPRLPGDFFEITKGHEDNPYVAYPTDRLYLSLSREPNRPEPGSRHEYSNLGAGLLGHVLARVLETDYETAIKTAVSDPLGLDDTTITLNAEQRDRLVSGHAPGGKLAANWDFDVLAPAGAFRSTADDLLRFLAAQFDEAPAYLTTAQEQQSPDGTRPMGLGWLIESTGDGRTIQWHNGGTGGYMSFVGMDKEHKIGVVLLSNYGDAFAGDHTLDQIGFRLLRLAAQGDPDPTR